MKVRAPRLFLTTVLLVSAGTASATILVEEDFSGTPGANLTTKSWTNLGGPRIDLQSTTIDVDNSAALTTSSYSHYGRQFPSPVESLAEGDELIIQWSFWMDPGADGWVRFGVNKADSNLGYGQTYNTHDLAIGQTGGGDFPSGLSSIFLADNILYDMRTVVTATAISYEFKERSSPTWTPAPLSGSGEFSATGVDEAYIDGQNTGFFIDTLSVSCATCDMASPSMDGAWTKDRTGPWDSAGNWDIFPVPNTADHTVTFADAISSPTSVVVDNDVSINAITFDHDISYTVVGLGSLNLEANTDVQPRLPTISVAQGDHQFVVITNLLDNTSADVAPSSTLSFNHALNLMGHTLAKTGTGTMFINNVLTTGGGTIDVQEGTVSGGGTIGGDLSNDGGTLSPGNNAGIMTIEGDYVQSAAGALLLEIAGTVPGTEYDSLIVDGQASLDGALGVALLGGHQPAAGDSFGLLEITSLAGEFYQIDLPDLSTGLIWDISNLYANGRIAVVPEPGGALLLVLSLLVLLGYRGGMTLRNPPRPAPQTSGR